jgi:hypothetical protein
VLWKQVLFLYPLHPFSCPTLPHGPRSRKGYLGLLQRNFIILSALKKEGLHMVYKDKKKLYFNTMASDRDLDTATAFGQKYTKG